MLFISTLDMLRYNGFDQEQPEEPSASESNQVQDGQDQIGLRCPFCDQVFGGGFYVLKHHVNNFHDCDIEPGQAEEIVPAKAPTKATTAKTTPAKITLASGSNQDQNKIVDCSICEEVFVGVNNLKVHMKTVHEMEADEASAEATPAKTTPTMIDKVTEKNRLIEMGK